MLVSDLMIYPIKSIKALHLNESLIDQNGLCCDRRWAIVDEQGKAVTGRTHTQLLDVQTEIRNDHLEIKIPEQAITKIPLVQLGTPTETIKIFSAITEGIVVSEQLNELFSLYLEKPVKVLFQSKERPRYLSESTGGRACDTASFADEAPILIASESSLEDLNQRLETPIKMDRFRPNIVISGTKPYEEDQWKYITIGEVTFEVVNVCNRCIFTTIDPLTKEKHPSQEPLRTLLTYRKGDPRNNSLGYAVAFGMHLVPRKLGRIKKGDRLRVIKKEEIKLIK